MMMNNTLAQLRELKLAGMLQAVEVLVIHIHVAAVLPRPANALA